MVEALFVPMGARCGFSCVNHGTSFASVLKCSSPLSVTAVYPLWSLAALPTAVVIHDSCVPFLFPASLRAVARKGPLWRAPSLRFPFLGWALIMRRV